MRALLAAVPLLAVVASILAGRTSRTAALIGCGAVLTVAAIAFPVTAETALQAGRDWAPVVLEVVLVIGGGILFAETGRATGSQATLAAWLTRSLGTGIAPVLAIVHGFTPLTESVTGYGIGAALAVPLLLGLGLPGKRAAIVGLLGLCAVPWGSMGPGTLIAAQLTGVDFDALGVTTAIFNGTVFLAVGIAAALLVSPPGRRLTNCLAAVASGLVLWGGVLGTNLLIGTAPAGALGGLLVLVCHLAFRVLSGHPVRVSRAVLRAARPYGVVLGGVLVATLTFAALGLADSLAADIGGSPALWLFAAVIPTLLLRREIRGPALRSAARTWVRVAPAIVLFIGLGAAMGVSGMSEELAAQLAKLGASYRFLLPLFAALIGFITGSNSGANALAAGAQGDVARVLGADVPLAIGAHNAAGAAAMMASPARVELATRLALVPGEARSVQRTLLLVLAIAVAAMGLVSLILL